MEDKQQQQEEQKEVSSTQQTTIEQIQDKGFHPDVKEYTPLPSANDVKLKSCFKLFNFTGDRCETKILNYIKMFENLADRADWSDEEKKWNLVSYLEGEAFDYYVENVLSKADELDWSKAKQLVLTRFDRFERDSFMELLSYKYTPRVSLRNHFLKIRALGINADRSVEDIIKHLNRIVPQHFQAELSNAADLQQWSNICAVLEAKDIQAKKDAYHGGYHNNHWKGNRRGNRQSKPRSNQQNESRTNTSLAKPMNENA